MNYISTTLRILSLDDMNHTKMRLVFEIAAQNSARLTAVTLCELTEYHPQTVYRSLRELEKSGWIYGGRLTEKACRYLGLTPSEYQPERVVPKAVTDFV